MTRSINQIDQPDGDKSDRKRAIQNAYSSALPDFRNIGILLRILVIVNAVALLVAVVKSADLAELGAQIIDVAALVEPLLILTLVVLYALNGVLSRLS